MWIHGEKLILYFNHFIYLLQFIQILNPSQQLSVSFEYNLREKITKQVKFANPVLTLLNIKIK